MPVTQTSQAGSLALPLLSAILKKNGIHTDLFYLNLRYNQFFDFADERRRHKNEFIFADLCFGANKVNRPFIRKNKPFLTEEEISYALKQKKRLKDYFERMLDNHPWEQYSIVGFSINYYQLFPSMAMARLLKEKHEDLKVIFGGSMFTKNYLAGELIKNEPYLDYVIEGEADNAITDIVSNVFKGIPIHGKGIYSKNKNGEGVEIRRVPVDLNALPFPDYTTLIRQYQNMVKPHVSSFSVNMEISRACAKGEKDPCKFCNEMDRAGGTDKRVEKIAEEIHHHKKKFNIFQINISDPLIQIGPFLKALKKTKKLNLKFTSYGILPNINRKTIEELSAHGVVHFQVGVENFDNQLLKLLNKKVDYLRCVNVLKWCQFYGVVVEYNILTNIPGEEAENYDSQMNTLRLITHLRPPRSVNGLYNVRGSSLWREQERYRIKNLPDNYLNWFPGKYDRFLSSYFFAIDFPEKHKCAKAIEDLNGFVEYWGKHDGSFSLNYIEEKGAIKVTDKRGKKKNTRCLTKTESEIFLLLEEPVFFQKIVELSGKDKGTVRRTLNKLMKFELVLKNEKDFFLGLALPALPRQGDTKNQE